MVGFSTFPVWDHLNLATAPDWARIVLLLAALEAFYILWMLLTPDWASVWVVTLIFALVATLYGMATAVAMASPLDQPLPLELGPLRRVAPRCCGSVALCTLLAAYLCGHMSATWRRAAELRIGGRSRRPA